ncbi:MAG: hypothetical protein KA715_13725 [Xanthomonadaceae bacterium]|nr:hypothetical protein [Xanthomonadaceae bacterium]
MQKSMIVVGDGFSALTSVLLSLENIETCSNVVWISGTGSRLVPPTNSIDMGKGALMLEKLMQIYGMDSEGLIRGKFLREFRNKSFREPVWNAAPTPDFKRESLLEWVSDGEMHLVSLFEVKFNESLLEVFEALRSIALKHDRVKRYEGFPVKKIENAHGQYAVTLANGETVYGESMIYADRLSSLRDIETAMVIQVDGKKLKPLELERKCDARSVLQIEIEHKTPIGSKVNEHFFTALHHESDDTYNHQVWGYFTEDGKRSIWSVVLAPGDADDNHQISKRLRRMKQALNKTFSEGWLPEGVQTFTDIISKENVRMEDAILFSKVEPFDSPLMIECEAGKIPLFTDGFGMSFAIQSAAETVLGNLLAANTNGVISLG